MTIYINGDSGITDVNGTAAAPAITGTDTDTGVYFGTNTLGLSTNGTAAVTVDSSQNVGIGTTSPSSYSSKTWISGTGGTSNNTFGFDDGATGLALRFNLVNNTSPRQINFQVNPDGSAFSTKLTLDGSGNLLFNSGYGSVATAYGVRAWVNWDGSTGSGNTIRASGNVSSVTRTGTGLFTITFTNAMPDANYVFSGSGIDDAINTNIVSSQTTARTTSNLYVKVSLPNNSAGNPTVVNVIVIR